ncbi:MAG: T9SS type A sorting domain-containing protein, partial [Crocinitomicaceae bacterium]|nr:T9SS type A sorting domain-containing protein [Crocinitomicaceae bacterium]
GRVIFESSEEIESLQVLSLSGKVLRSETPNNSRFMMDTAGLVEGVYVVVIQTPTATKSLKLVRGN